MRQSSTHGLMSPFRPAVATMQRRGENLCTGKSTPYLSIMSSQLSFTFPWHLTLPYYCRTNAGYILDMRPYRDDDMISKSKSWDCLPWYFGVPLAPYSDLSSDWLVADGGSHLWRRASFPARKGHSVAKAFNQGPTWIVVAFLFGN